MKSVLAEELKLISLSRKEILELDRLAKGFIALLKKAGVRAFVGGSLAKGTLVRKDVQDIDIFVVFDYSEDIVKLEGVLKRVKLPGRLKRVHGSRDYFQVDCGDVLLEVIPVVKNKDPELAENVTDVSLRHVKYVVGKVKKDPRLADEIRLAKAFCWAQRCYGAESYVRGFSGYALEVLVIYFGGFVKFLRGIKGRSVIDPLKYFKGERDVMNEINASKLNSPIVLVDPTYKFRNVTAGLGLESFEKFCSVSGRFLKSPSLDFFERKDVDVEGARKFARKNGARFVEVDLGTDRQEGDIAGTKMKKLLDFFARELERKGQEVLRKEFDYSGVGKKAKGYLVVLEKGEIEVRGPSVGLQDSVVAFKKANRAGSVFSRKKFWWVRKKVSVEKVFDLVKKVEGEMGASGELA
jgi:tRNA nucleotidyltransferase (CCA-adding enzyme)